MRGRKRVLLLASLLALLVALPGAAGPPENANNVKHVTVMTRNLYLGADLTPVIMALVYGTPEDVVAAVSVVWGGVRFTDFPARAEGLAREIQQVKPDLIALQEAELWRSQTPSDILQGNPVPNAETVEYDFVQLLLDALAAKGLHYAVVIAELGVDVEFPGFLSAEDYALGVVSDIRMTDREVILARTDLKTSELKLSNPQTGHFETNVIYPVGDGFVTVLRGWASVDAKVRGKSFRFLATHLEADSPDVRDAQAAELIAGPANTPLPVVLAADINSNANGNLAPTAVDSAAYDLLIGHGFTDAWFEAHPGSVVSTCCNAPDLTNPLLPDPTDDEGRIDVLLYRGPRDFGTLGAALLGTNAAEKVPNLLGIPIWPSDHAGVAAKLRVMN